MTQDIDEARLLLAAVAMHALLKCETPATVHIQAVQIADALLAELEKEKP